LEDLTDNIAVRLGTKLLDGNANINELALNPGPTLTTSGAQTLANRLSSSSVDALSSNMNAITDQETMRILFRGFGSISELQLSYELHDEAAGPLMAVALVGNTFLKSLGIQPRRQLIRCWSNKACQRTVPFAD
jgi:hypothetical protein